jgi:hypothetical protein
LVYFVAIWYVLWPLGVFFPFRYVLPRKIWQPRSLALISKLHWYPVSRPVLTLLTQSVTVVNLSEVIAT